MAVDDAGVIDMISRENASDEVVLTVSDHLSWADTPGHLFVLQEKLNTYLAFIESGEIDSAFEAAQGRKVRIDVGLAEKPNKEAERFFEEIAKTLGRADIGFRYFIVPPDLPE